MKIQIKSALIIMLLTAFTFTSCGANSDSPVTNDPSADGSTDIIAPAPGNSGTINVTSITNNSLILNWEAATDDATAQLSLSYKVYQSINDNINTVENCENNGIMIEDFTTGLLTKTVTALSASTPYYFNVVVKDSSGNKTCYTTKLQATSSIADITTPIAGNGGIISTAGIAQNSLVLNWTAGTDNITAPLDLQYAVYQSASNNISTVTDSETNGTKIIDYTTNLTSHTVTGLSANTPYYFNVVVIDSAGNKTCYTTKLQSTLEAALQKNVLVIIADSLVTKVIAKGYNSSDILIGSSELVKTGSNWTENMPLSQTGNIVIKAIAYDASSEELYQGLLPVYVTGTNYTATIPMTAITQIIADHTVVSKYSMIPQRYIDEVKKMWINIPGESHSEAYRTGLTLLQSADTRFAANTTDGISPEAYTTAHLRSSRALRTIYSNWIFGTGEAAWYTWYAASPTGSDSIQKHILYCDTNNIRPAVIGFGWCWDMSWINNPGGTEDPVYHVRWAGSSDGGIDGNKIWGLDAGDYALTGNRISMDTYLNATELYRKFCTTSGYTTKVIFTTGPVDGADGENGYQRHLKHQYIRNFVNANTHRILFDYADILCYNDDGTTNTTTFKDSQQVTQTYPIITTTNAGDGSIGHIGSAGAIRLAKAQWYMLARIAGWDGVSQ